jgi:hypothetical protein
MRAFRQSEAVREGGNSAMVGNLKEAASDLDHLAELAEWAATIGVER